MIDALERRKVYAVGLDVYKNEPNLNPGYLNHKSAFILPHLGSATKDTRTAMANLAIDNLDEFFNTGNCKNNFKFCSWFWKYRFRSSKKKKNSCYKHT